MELEIPNEWLTRYLMNRQQCVSIQGTNSTLLEVKSGVAQGSIYEWYSNFGNT